MKVFVAHMTSECNEHVRKDATLDDFLLLYGDECIDAMHVRDIFEGHGIQIVPSIFASLHPSGMIEKAAFDYICDTILDTLKSNIGEIDAIICSFTGQAAFAILKRYLQSTFCLNEYAK